MSSLSSGAVFLYFKALQVSPNASPLREAGAKTRFFLRSSQKLSTMNKPVIDISLLKMTLQDLAILLMRKVLIKKSNATVTVKMLIA